MLSMSGRTSCRKTDKHSALGDGEVREEKEAGAPVSPWRVSPNT